MDIGWAAGPRGAGLPNDMNGARNMSGARELDMLMDFLMANVWILPVAAAVLGLLIGLILRGAMLSGRIRRAEVERGIAQTELEQALAEIEALYQAQRKAAEADPQTAADTAERDARLSSLQAQLEARTQELEALKTRAAEPPAAPQASAEDATAETSEEALEARNQYLESRVRRLEQDLHAATAEASAEPTAPEPSEAAQDAPEGVALAETASETSSGTEIDQLRWQADYLRTRLKAFEQGLGPVAATPSAAREQRAGETAEEELARLRWRNRYLEGRLAYLEEERQLATEPPVPAAAEIEQPADAAETSEPPVLAEEVVADPAPAEETSSPSAIASEAPEPADPATPDEPAMPAEGEIASAETEPEHDMQAGETDAPAPSDLMADTPEAALPEPVESSAPAPAEAEEQTAAPTVSNGADRVRPPALDAPRGGQADDLTQIEGIGPRIEEVLNALGVYHYDQLAAWTPENEAWVDDYLNFSGRVSREAWVAQASDRLTRDATA